MTSLESTALRKLGTVGTQIVCASQSFASAPLSSELIHKVKTCLFDLIGCAFESGDLPWSRQAIHLASLPGVRSGACVIGSPVLASLGEAAFANGVMGHGLVREDMHSASISHLGIVILPTLLALAQYQKVSGKRLIQAAVLGYETGAQLGRVLMDADLASIYRPTGITGPIGATAGACYLLGLSADATASALGLSANTTSGFNQWAHTGGSEMFFHPGFAARSAVTAALLAEQGAFASHDAIDGQAGLFASLRKSDVAAHFKMFSGEPEILSVYHKPVPACNFAQTATQAALRLSLARQLAPAEITSVVVHVPKAAALYPGCDSTGPFENILQAKMSIQFNVVSALLHGAVTERNFEQLDDPLLQKILCVTSLKIDPVMTAAYPGLQGGEVIVTLRDGQTQCVRLDNVVNASFEQVHARFKKAAMDRLGLAGAEALESFIFALEFSDDAGAIGPLFQTPRVICQESSN